MCGWTGIIFLNPAGTRWVQMGEENQDTAGLQSPLDALDWGPQLMSSGLRARGTREVPHEELWVPHEEFQVPHREFCVPHEELWVPYGISSTRTRLHSCCSPCSPSPALALLVLPGIQLGSLGWTSLAP